MPAGFHATIHFRFARIIAWERLKCNVRGLVLVAADDFIERPHIDVQ